MSCQLSPAWMFVQYVDERCLKLIEFHRPSLSLFQPINGLSDDLLIHFVDFHTAANSGKQRNCRFSAQMLLKVGKTSQQQRPAPRVTLPKLVATTQNPAASEDRPHARPRRRPDVRTGPNSACRARRADRHGLAMVDFITCG